MKIELHLIQNFPPSNLNRDDSGMPKDADFGGYRRARISSQCLKRSIRHSDGFRREVTGALGVRTKRTAEVVEDILVEKFGRTIEDARIVARTAMQQLAGKSKEDGISSVLLYAGYEELEEIAGMLVNRWEELEPLVAAALAVEANPQEDLAESGTTGNGKPKKGGKGKKGGADEKGVKGAMTSIAAEVIKKFLASRSGKALSVDIALFGRMLAENPVLNVDAACQVAHAISTNKVSMEFDYFTAVDDLNPEGQTGAGMIGTVGFNSSCFYRYALVDLELLVRNLGGNREGALEAVRGFIRGAIEAIPTGKQNTFAAHVPPSFIMVVVRRSGMPWSLANAFEYPIRPQEGKSLVAGSIEALDRYWKRLADVYGAAGATPYLVNLEDGAQIEALQGAEVASVEDLIREVIEALEQEEVVA